jgi:hypothetical protein
MITPKIKFPIEYLNLPESEEEKDFFVSITLAIGPENEEGADLFYFYVVSPARLVKILSGKSFVLGKDKIILEKFDQNLVEREITKILEQCSRNTWSETAQALNRFLFWEYDKR